MSNILPALPEIFLAGSILALLLVGVFSAKENASRSVLGLSLVSLVVTLLLILSGSLSSHHIEFAFPYGQGLDGGPAGFFFISDLFSIYAKSLILLVAIIAIILSEDVLNRLRINKFEFYILVLVSVLGMMVMVSSHHLLTMYMGLELMSFSLYVLVSFWRDNNKSSEAGLKYFVLGSLASGLLLFGLSYIYGVVGDLSFTAIGDVISDIQMDGQNVTLVVALVLVMTALAFKLSAVPFHMWTPDVYQGAPTPVTTFMAAGPKVAAFALLMRLLTEPFAAMAADWTQVIIALSILTMAVGSYMAIVQTNLKRLLAYSSIGHVGFMLVGLVGGTAQGVQSVLMYLTIYSLMTMGAFGLLMLLRRKDIYLETIDDVAGLSEQAPAYAFMLMLLMFSIAGIPPLAGFFAKFYVFSAAVAAGYSWLAILAVLFSVIVAYYVLRVVRSMYFDKMVSVSVDLSAPLLMRGVVVGLVIFVAGYIFAMQPLDEFTYRAAESLLLAKNF